MTEKRTPYMDHMVVNEPATITNIAPQTAILSFGASGADRRALRTCVACLINGVVGNTYVVGFPADFPAYTISRVVQFQVSEPWQSSGIQKWHCDGYILCEIAPEPTSLNQGLAAARVRIDAMVGEALGDELPPLGNQVMSASGEWLDA